MPTATVLLVSTKPFIAARVEEFLDRRFEALFRALGWRERVVAYTGYGSNEFVRVMARVVLAPQWSRSQLGRATKEFVKRRGWRSFITAPCVRVARPCCSKTPRATPCRC